MNKRNLGQFYTTNFDYILQGIDIPLNVKHILEPFVGKGDLLKFIKNKDNYTFELYDIDPKYNNSIKRNTLLNPPSYKDKFILTNPPYLSRNKSSNKETIVMIYISAL